MPFSHGRIEIQHTKLRRYNRIELALCERDAILGNKSEINTKHVTRAFADRHWLQIQRRDVDNEFKSGVVVCDCRDLERLCHRGRPCRRGDRYRIDESPRHSAATTYNIERPNNVMTSNKELSFFLGLQYKYLKCITK
jgi:hypothetical protein